MVVFDKEFKVNKRTYFLSFLIFILYLVSFHNLNIMMMYKLPDRALDERLSSIVNQNEKNSGLKFDLYDRITEESVLSEFFIIAREFYEGRDVVIKDGLISENILRKSGFAKIVTLDKFEINQERETEFLSAAESSLWYNPLIFSDKGYVKTSRYPFKTEPEFDQEYPISIIFIQSDDFSQEPVSVFECGRYLVFFPGVVE